MISLEGTGAVADAEGSGGNRGMFGSSGSPGGC